MRTNGVGSQQGRVSIVIPCYNAGQHLEEAVQSALDQTYSDVEIIIVDDGSDDSDTLQLLKGARWPRTRIIQQPNAGPAAARNRAISEATGSYILPLDADDVLEPEYVAKGVSVLDSQPSIGVVYCRAKKFGVEVGPWELPAYALHQLAIDNVIFVTALYRREDWSAVGGYNESLVHGMEDYDFWVKMVHRGLDVLQLDDFLFNYRVQETSRTTRFLERAENVVHTYAEIFRGNKDFYSKHAEAIFQHRFALYDQLTECREQRTAFCRQLGESQQRIGDLSQQLEISAQDAAGLHERLEKSVQDMESLRQELADRHEAHDRLSEQLAHWQRRYGRLDGIFNRHVWLLRLARRVKALLDR